MPNEIGKIDANKEDVFGATCRSPFCLLGVNSLRVGTRQKPPRQPWGQSGIRPVEPGWSTYEVMPKEAFLTRIKVVVPSIKGPVRMELNKTGKHYLASLPSSQAPLSATTPLTAICSPAFSGPSTLIRCPAPALIFTGLASNPPGIRTNT